MIGKQYDLSSFPQVKQTRFKTIKQELQKINNTPEEIKLIEPIPTIKDEKQEEVQNIIVYPPKIEVIKSNPVENKEYKSFWSRLKWLITGN
jgi:hypothetical protein